MARKFKGCNGKQHAAQRAADAKRREHAAKQARANRLAKEAQQAHHA